MLDALRVTLPGSLVFTLRGLDAAFDLPQHGSGDLVRRLTNGDLNAPVVEEVDVPEQGFRVRPFRQRQVQPMRRHDIGAVRGEVGKRALGQLLVHARHRAVHAGVVKVVLVFPGDFRRRLQYGAVQRDARVARIRLYPPAPGKRLVHDGALILPKLPDGRQEAGAGVDVRDVEHAHGLVGVVGVDGVDGLAAPANPEVAAIPLLHGGAGHGVGALRGNQQRVFKGVFVERSD